MYHALLNQIYIKLFFRINVINIFHDSVQCCKFQSNFSIKILSIHFIYFPVIVCNSVTLRKANYCCLTS